jgi:hypothetical protein
VREWGLGDLSGVGQGVSGGLARFGSSLAGFPRLVSCGLPFLRSFLILYLISLHFLSSFLVYNFYYHSLAWSPKSKAIYSNPKPDNPVHTYYFNNY